MKRLLIFLFFASAVFAQQPQAPQGTPPFDVNARYTSGVGVGYAPTKDLTGLTLHLAGGTVVCSGTTPTFYAGGTLAMTNSTTNYVYLNISGCAPASNTSGFTSSTIPIAIVVTAGGNITTLTDVRSLFNSGTGGGGGGGSGPPFLGPNPWFDVTNPAYAGGAKCDGVTDDTAAFQATINAASSAPSGTVYIPWNSPVTAPVTNVFGCIIKGGLTIPDTGYWINILQVGNILVPANATASLLTGNIQNMWWLGVPGQGGGAVNTFGEPSTPTIGNYSNLPTLNSATTANLRFENMNFSCPSSTTAHCLNFTTTSGGGFVGITFINVSAGVGSGTGAAINLDCSLAAAGGNGCFNIKIAGGAWAATSSSATHSSINMIDLGQFTIGDPTLRMTLIAQGIVLTDTGTTAGSGLGHVQNILVEGLSGPIFTGNVTGTGGGIQSIAIDRVDIADCVSGCSIFKGHSTTSSPINGVSVTNSSGGYALAPTSDHVNGFISVNNFEVNDMVAPPVGTDMLVEETNFFTHYAETTSSLGFNQARGFSVFGCANPSTNSGNMSCDPLNGYSGVIYSTLPGGGNGAVHRFSSAAADPFVTFETSNGGVFALEFCALTNGCPASISYNDSNKSIQFNANNNSAVLYGTSVGNFTAGDFAAPTRLAFAGAGSNPGFLTGSLTSPRTYTFPDATGTVCLTSTCTGAVTSVFGRAGVVVAATNDYTQTQIASGAIANGSTATTQTVGDNTTKVATDAFVIANAGSGGTPGGATNTIQYNNAGAFGGIALPTTVAGLTYTFTSTGGLGAWGIQGRPTTAAQTGVYTFNGAGAAGTGASADQGLMILANPSAARVYTLPQAGTTGFANAPFWALFNENASFGITLTPTTSTVNGTTTALVPPLGFSIIGTDSTNANYIAATVPTLNSSGFVPCSFAYALTGDATSSAGSCATTVAQVNGAAVPTSANVLGSNSSNQFVAATSAQILAACTGCAPLASPTFTGVPAGPTATVGTNTTQLATTAFVLANAGGGVTTMNYIGTTQSSQLTGGTDHCAINTSDNGVTGCTYGSASAAAQIVGASTIKGLFVHLQVALTTGQTLAVTVFKNGSTTTMTCTISSTQTDCNDTTHTFSVIDTDVLNYDIVGSATLAAGTVSFLLKTTN